jgi:hypothetical protein
VFRVANGLGAEARPGRSIRESLPFVERSQDANGGPNNTLGTAASINSSINTSTKTGLVQNLDVTAAGQSDYFTFRAPSGTGSTLKVSVQSSGLSLLFGAWILNV